MQTIIFSYLTEYELFNKDNIPNPLNKTPFKGGM